MKHRLNIVSFYSCLGVVVVTAIAFTLYQGSLFLFQAQKLSKLEHDYRVLAAKRQELGLELAEKTALAAVVPAQDSGYESITKPLIVKLNTTVAVR